MELLTRFDDSTVTIYNHHSDANHHNNIRALPSVTMRPERSMCPVPVQRSDVPKTNACTSEYPHKTLSVVVET